jgi:hypothetical protein
VNYWKARKVIADSLRKIADNIYEDTTYRCFPAYYYFEHDKGLVIHETDGVICGPVPGAPLYLREDEYDQAHRD